MTIDQTVFVSGGGIIGSIRSVLLADPQISQTFGNRVSPGRLAAGWQSANSTATTPISYPCIVLADISGTFNSDVFYKDQRIDMIDSMVQVDVYANNYNDALAFGDYVYGIMRQVRYWNVAGNAVFLMPFLRHEILQPKRTETGSDCWQSLTRWHYVRQIGIQPISSLSTVNGKGFLALPGLLSSGSGAAS